MKKPIGVILMAIWAFCTLGAISIWIQRLEVTSSAASWVKFTLQISLLVGIVVLIGILGMQRWSTWWFAGWAIMVLGARAASYLLSGTPVEETTWRVAQEAIVWSAVGFFLRYSLQGGISGSSKQVPKGSV